MQVIQPGLFLLMQRFQDRKKDLRKIYGKSESFRSICHSYRTCLEAIEYWSTSEHEQAPLRTHEYAALIRELEKEIHQNLEECE